MVFKKETTEHVINTATARLSGDIAGLANRRESALSSFRRTANELQSINEGLKVKQGHLRELAAFIEAQEGATEKMMSDNEAVRSRILEIIGE